MTEKDITEQSTPIPDKTGTILVPHEFQPLLPEQAEVRTSDRENRQLVPLRMEEAPYEIKESTTTIVCGIIGGGFSWFAADACCPGAGTVTHALVTAGGAASFGLFAKPVTLRCMAECDDPTPPQLRF